MTTKRETRPSARTGPPLPTSPPESPKGGRFGGRGEQLAETLTQGGATGSCPRLPWATFRRPSRALKMKQRPPCRCTSRKMSKLQIPAKAGISVTQRSLDCRFRGTDAPSLVRHRIDDVVDPQTEGCGCVLLGVIGDVGPFPRIAQI